MAMTLGEFHARISRALRRGTSQDDIIPDVVAEAALWLEQNYSFSYMDRLVQITITPPGDALERIDFPSSLVKSWKFVRWSRPPFAGSSDVEDYTYLKRVQPEDFLALSSGCPEGWCTDGDTQIVLDAVPTETLVLQLGYVEYTDWPEDLASSPSLLIKAHNLLRAQTLLMMSMETRDPRLVEVYTSARNDALSAVLRAEEESKNSAESPVMQYSSPFRRRDRW